MTPSELREAEALAKATNRSLSGLVREGLQRIKIEQRWTELNAYGRKNARRLGLTEKDVSDPPDEPAGTDVMAKP